MFNNSSTSMDCYGTNESNCSLSMCFRSYFGSNCSAKILHEWNQTVIDDFLSEGCNCASLVSDNCITNWVCKPYAVQHPWWIQFIYFVMFGFIILASIGGNLTVIWIVLAHKRMRTVTNYFLVNLAIADASISLFNVCFSFTFNLYYDWFFGKTYCIFNNFMGVVPTCASVFTLMSMSLDRFVAIVYPLKRRLSQKKTLAIIICIWVAACLCGLPMLLYSHTMTFFFESGYENTVCLSDQYPDDIASVFMRHVFYRYNYILLSITYLLPLAVLTATYTRMGIELWGNQSIGDHRHEVNIKAKKKIVKMMIVVVAIFMTCWLPYHLYFTIFIRQFANIDISTAVHIYLNMYWLAMSSTVANPIIYAWLNSRFRTGFKYIFRWLPCINMTEDQYSNSELKRDRFDSAGYTVMQRKATVRQSRNFDKTNYRNGAFNNISTIESTTTAAVRRGKRIRSISSGTQLTSVEEEPFSQALSLMKPDADCYLLPENDVVF